MRVAIIGGGFGGIGAAIRLHREGIDDFVILEKGDQLGGTWRDNTYPGCACDVPSTLYSYSFARKPDWSRVFAEQPEIQEYLLQVADHHDVPERVRFGCELLGAAWSDERQEWDLDTTQGPLAARVLIVATGPLHEPTIPDLPGIARFEGKMFHSARWDHDHDLTGERVAVVGTGSSAIQFVPKIQPRVGKLHLFQRTAPWVLPKIDHVIPPIEKAIFHRLPFLQRIWRAVLYYFFELVQLAQRRPGVMSRLHGAGLSNMRRSISDPKLQEALTPSFVLGCKRILLSNTYYPALAQPNVEVVPAAVQEIRERSIVGADGVEREVDTIIFGTGFHVTDPPTAGRVRGRDGRTMAEVWEGSPQAYLGTAVNGFPNLFELIGPNTGNGHTSAIVLIEAQLEYAVGALRAMERENITSVEVRRDVQDAYNARVQEALAGTVWNSGGCSSYYLDRNGRNATIYPWTTIDLRRRTAQFDLAEYDTVAAPAHAEPVAA